MPSQAQGILQRKMAMPEPRPLSEMSLPPAQKSTRFNWMRRVNSSTGLELLKMSTSLESLLKQSPWKPLEPDTPLQVLCKGTVHSTS